MTFGRSAQANLPRQLVERADNIRLVELVAPAGNEQVWRHRATLPVAFTLGNTFGKDLTARVVQRNKTVPADCCRAYGQYRGVDIDIREFEIVRLYHSDAGNDQQSEQAMVDPGMQGASFVGLRHVQRSLQQLADLFVRKETGFCPFGSEGQQSGWRDLRPWIGGFAMPGEHPHDAQAARPMRRLGVHG